MLFLKIQSGNQVTDMKNAVIDMNSKIEGIQEGKEWLALMEMISLNERYEWKWNS